MPIRAQEITEAALALPSTDRAMLADRLVESLDPADEGVFHQVWAVEAQRRLQELRSGTVAALPGEASIDRLRTKFTG